MTEEMMREVKGRQRNNDNEGGFLEQTSDVSGE